jgi:hypothetical protein
VARRYCRDNKVSIEEAISRRQLPRSGYLSCSEGRRAKPAAQVFASLLDSRTLVPAAEALVPQFCLRRVHIFESARKLGPHRHLAARNDAAGELFDLIGRGPPGQEGNGSISFQKGNSVVLQGAAPLWRLVAPCLTGAPAVLKNRRDAGHVSDLSAIDGKERER